MVPEINEPKKGPNKGVGKNKTGPYARKSGYMSCIEPGRSKMTMSKKSHEPVTLPPPKSIASFNTQSSGSSIPSEYKLPQEGKKKTRKVNI